MCHGRKETPSFLELGGAEGRADDGRPGGTRSLLEVAIMPIILTVGVVLQVDIIQTCTLNRRSLVYVNYAPIKLLKNNPSERLQTWVCTCVTSCCEGTRTYKPASPDTQ